MRIFVTGTRGIPDIPGGVEKHCQELYPLISAMGHSVTVATRTPYIKEKAASWQGIQLAHLYAPHKKSLEAIGHTFLAVLEAKKEKADLIHIHAVGPGLMAPFARLLGLKVVVTNHGPDYDRQKWGVLAKTMLQLGEYLSGKFANQIIVISSVIAEIIRKRCGRDSNLIYNGVPLPDRSESTSYLDRTAIKPKNYILAVARFVPEKGLHDLIEAFADLKRNYQLVIAGDADHQTTYSRELKQLAAVDKRIILTGYITGEDLNQVFTHARLFCLPSYHEGLPIALLEAMSYGLPVLVSDIPANREVDLPAERFFKCGDVKDLHEKLERLIDLELSDKEQQLLRTEIIEKYNWQKIAEQTVAVYQKALL
ncbi:MAG: glycosyltransferase family 4 protein [Proteobacteria bacterium]|nr:glycosyltransferase family 4 protein [Desulfocapsa sp.]MBU3946066.1 glycosyltransferase family 4 protein [Pseudomonadota bacterium]MCG2744780.1 glycosyltransferase family 4 protein [Desulfobacteraceae bacterium]MBU3984863.1 glycosyltransferase family 4 protein [Pseudomonadota bacterium]MBU4028390.1 glycosyltransferase family 4 protein [Pseudomonadota bacterium]